MKMINIGFGNLVASSRLVTVVSPDSAPVKRIVQEAQEKATLVDCTCGRKTKSVILTDSGHIILSAVSGDTIAARVNGKENDTDGEEDH